MLLALVAACAGPPPAPVEDRGALAGAYALTPDGHYRVRRGDSIYAIAFRFSVDWRDLADWNGIGHPYVIHPDQLLRLAPSVDANQSTAAESGDISISGTGATRPASTRPLLADGDSPSVATGVAGPQPGGPDEHVAGTGSGARETPAAGESEPATPPPEPAGASRGPAGSDYAVPAGDPRRWLWPTEGRLRSRFAADDPARKGIDIAGTVGQSVVASADGRVAYSGSGLIGYGELVIIQHSDRMLSAYAHNSRRLVAEGEVVQAGQKISEMGTNDRNEALLHFEIRVNGVPQDPLRYLPSR